MFYGIVIAMYYRDVHANGADLDPDVLHDDRAAERNSTAA